MRRGQISFVALEQILLAAVALLIAITAYYVYKSSRLEKTLQRLEFDIRSQQVRYGKAWEKFAPFMENFPYDPNSFKFIGEPIDGIVFDPEKIVFLEIKTGKSALTQKQRAIRELVKAKKVEWEELRF